MPRRCVCVLVCRATEKEEDRERPCVEIQRETKMEMTYRSCLCLSVCAVHGMTSRSSRPIMLLLLTSNRDFPTMVLLLLSSNRECAVQDRFYRVVLRQNLSAPSALLRRSRVSIV